MVFKGCTKKHKGEANIKVFKGGTKKQGGSMYWGSGGMNLNNEK